MKNIHIHMYRDTYREWQSRLTVSHVENNAIIKNNTQYKYKLSCTHHCKPIFAQHVYDNKYKYKETYIIQNVIPYFFLKIMMMKQKLESRLQTPSWTVQ